MPVSPARAAAFDILLRVEREASYASELLHADAFADLTTADHALTTEIVMGVLRWRGRLDSEIAEASSQALAKLDAEVLMALRIGLYQLRWLDRVPARAAIHESVELTKRARKRSAAPFVNAVLRKLTRRSTHRQGTSNGDESAEKMAREFSHPVWMVERWIREYGADVTRRICEHNQSVPWTAIRLRRFGVDDDLKKEGLETRPGALLAAARVVIAGDITSTAAFRDGVVVIQDEASQLVAALVGSIESDADKQNRILDCCAAPGGKTLAIADRNPHAEITAVELHPHRARLLEKLLQARQANNGPTIRVMTADAAQLPLANQYDRVLADVPCSGTGTLARNPEIKWRLTRADLDELAGRQCAILRSAMARLTPGGRLIYSTCSLEREENENVVEKVLASEKNFRLVDCKAELARLKAEGELTWPDPVSLTRGPFLRTLPGIHPCDGFFAAMIERN